MRRWVPATAEELALAREIPDNMPPLCYQIQRAARDIGTLPPPEFKRRFPELHRQLVKDPRARHRPRRIAMAQMAGAAAFHLDHEWQYLRWPVRELAQEAGIGLRRAERTMDDLRPYLKPGKQRKVELPPEAPARPGDKGKGRRYRGCAVRRHADPLFYNRLGVKLEADAEQKRRQDQRATDVENARIEREKAQISELLRLPHIRTAPTVQPVAVVDDDAKNTAVRKMTEQLRQRAEREAAAAPAPPPPARDPTGPPE